MLRRCAMYMLSFLLFLNSNVTPAYAEEFPYRQDYPEVPFITTEGLGEKYTAGESVIIDVRSCIEYDVIHPVDALNIPVSEIVFQKRTQEVIDQNSRKTITFYCNGVTCLKSYEAARKMIAAGCETCVVYDSGIFAWAQAFPENTLLLGEIVTDPENQFIPADEFKSKFLDFEAFLEKAGENGAMVIDARDPVQRVADLPGLENAFHVPCDKLIENFLQRKRKQESTLLIFDQVGKQVRWLQYHLKEHGYSDYYFLEGGATAVLEKQEYKFLK